MIHYANLSKFGTVAVSQLKLRQRGKIFVAVRIPQLTYGIQCGSPCYGVGISSRFETAAAKSYRSAFDANAEAGMIIPILLFTDRITAFLEISTPWNAGQ